MSRDYIFVAIMAFISICLARYIRWNELRKLGENSQNVSQKASKNPQVQMRERTPNQKIMEGGLTSSSACDEGGDHELGIHNKWSDSSGTARVFDIRAAQTREVLRNAQDAHGSISEQSGNAPISEA